MKLSQSEKVELYGRILETLLPLKLKTTPPPRNGEAKPANWPFATATWAKRVLDTAVYVLEKETEQTPTESSSEKGSENVPF